MLISLKSKTILTINYQFNNFCTVKYNCLFFVFFFVVVVLVPFHFLTVRLCDADTTEQIYSWKFFGIVRRFHVLMSC